jgi:Integrase core domain
VNSSIESQKKKETLPKNLSKTTGWNGSPLRFTNRLLKSKTGNPCQKLSKMDIKCWENGIQHQLTAPFTPKTNGMVERLNGTIKTNTILKTKYKDKIEMEKEFIDFMCYYNLYRRHGSLRGERNVKTPLQAFEKWFEMEPEIFNKTPNEFKSNLLILQSQNNQLHQQCCET